MPVRPKLTYANVMATIAVFLALGGGAYAAISGIPDSGGVFHACVNKSTGAVRVVKPGLACKSRKTRHGRVVFAGEFATAWNQRGPMGAKGDQGAPGKDGVGGPPGPYSDTLPSGQTLKGALYLTTTISSYDFAFSLPSAPVVHVRAFNASPTQECPGSASDPQAAPGHLCVYQSNNSAAGACVFATDDPLSSCTSATRFGFGGSSSGQFGGQWAVTAP